MLQTLFRVSGSIYMRVLFGILLVAFIIFGIGDVFRARGVAGGDVATVGKLHISPDDLNKGMEQRTRQFAGRIDMATLKKIGFLDKVLDAMIDNDLMEMAAHDEGFVVGNKQAVDEIQKIPVFQDEKTKLLDREKFTRVLAANQINESEFVTYLKRETATKLLATSELGEVPMPALSADAAYRYQNETRRGEMLRINAADMTVPPPNDEQLATFYHKHEADFTAPEYRDFSFLYLDLNTFADKVSVSPEEVKQAYDSHQADLKMPEQRDLSQIVFKDQAKAQAAYDASKGGKGLKAVGADEPMDLGLMTESDLPESLQAPVFAAAAGTILPPIQTSLGWHVIWVKAVKPAHTQSFEEAKAGLEADLKAEKAHTAMAANARQIDDQLAGGASLAEAGKAYGLTPVTVKGVDAEGKRADGSFAPELASRADVLKVAFASEKDAPAQIKAGAKDSDFAVTVEGITAPALRPLDSVKGKVTEGYTKEARNQAAVSKAADLFAKAKTGTDFAALAKQAGATPIAIGPILRSAKNKDVPPHVLGALFGLSQIGQAAQSNTAEGAVLVALTAINTPPEMAASDRAIMDKTLATQLQNDLTLQYEKALRAVYPVKIDQAVLEKMKTN